MKLNCTSKIFALSFALVSSALAADEQEQQPIGSLEALRSQVITGETVGLQWKISYPVHNFNQTDATVRVQFITCAIGPRSTIRFGTQITGGSYEEFYNGVSEEHPDYALSPETIISENAVEAGKEIDFLARHANSRITSHGGWVSSAFDDQAAQIIEVHRGDVVPDVPPVRGQRSVAEILAPYSENGIVTIGENQRILLFEVFTDDLEHNSFDLQDLVLLVSHDQISLDEL